MNGLNKYAGPTTGMVGQAARDPGVLTRVEAVTNSLHDLHEKLLQFGSRIAGQPSNKQESAPQAPGINGVLSVAESRLRDCHQMVDALHEAF